MGRAAIGGSSLGGAAMASAAAGGVAGADVAAGGTAIGSGTSGGSSTRASGAAGGGVAAGRVDTGVSVTAEAGARAATGGVPADDVVVGFEALVFTAIGFVVLEPFVFGAEAAGDVDRDGFGAGSGAGVGRSVRASALTLSLSRSPGSESSLVAVDWAGGGSLASSSSSGSMRSSVWSSLCPADDVGFGVGTVAAASASALSLRQRLPQRQCIEGRFDGQIGQRVGKRTRSGVHHVRAATFGNPGADPATGARASQPAGSQITPCPPRIVTPIALPP